jgi:hypothetical protein
MDKVDRRIFEISGGSFSSDSIMALLKSDQVEILDAWAAFDYRQLLEIQIGYIGMLRGMIDIALDAGDREWFRQLSSLLVWEIRGIGSGSSASSNQ